MVENDYYEQRLAKADSLRKLGHNPYANDKKPTHLAADVLAKYDEKTGPELESSHVAVCVAGRIVAVRSFGKSCFVKCQDGSGSIQAYIQQNVLSPDDYAVFELLDIGDVVHISGELFRTKTNELTIRAKNFSILTKSLRPLPEKWHGLTDVETRYRQRYVDLIANPEVRATFVKRAKIMEAVRAFFIGRGYLEVETPMMHPIPGGATARPFVTHHNTLDMDLYLRVAPELYLKRLLVGGMERVFEINRNFRNEGISTQHNPEFTMIEWYEAYATFEDQMRCTEEAIAYVCREVLGKTETDYQGTQLNFAPPYRRLKMIDAVKEIGQISPSEIKGISGAKLAELFETHVESKLIQPTFITHYPTEISPLARKNGADPSVTDRFELIVYGREIGNAYSELNDPLDQKQRMLEQADIKNQPHSGGEGGAQQALPVGGNATTELGDPAKLGERGSTRRQEPEGTRAPEIEAMYYDADYIRALEFGMPPAAGASIGIDRLVMFLTNSPSIRDVILFPLLRPEQS